MFCFALLVFALYIYLAKQLNSMNIYTLREQTIKYNIICNIIEDNCILSYIIGIRKLALKSSQFIAYKRGRERAVCQASKIFCINVRIVSKYWESSDSHYIYVVHVQIYSSSRSSDRGKCASHPWLHLEQIRSSHADETNIWHKQLSL